jgi:hypothetical protein
MRSLLNDYCVNFTQIAISSACSMLRKKNVQYRVECRFNILLYYFLNHYCEEIKQALYVLFQCFSRGR